MTSKTDRLYAVMVERGYPEPFARLVCSEMNTDYTAERMLQYVSGWEMHRLEDIADEMLAIRSERDRLVDKHISEHAQASINEWYRMEKDGGDEDED